MHGTTIKIKKLNRSGYYTIRKTFNITVSETEPALLIGVIYSVNDLEMSWSPCSGKLFFMCMHVFVYKHSHLCIFP